MTAKFSFRPYSSADEDALLQLNEEAVVYTSPLDSSRLAELCRQGCRITVADSADGVVGMLMAFTDGSEYNSVNYQWFAARLKGFLYIDRIVVAKSFQSAGIGSRFYETLKRESVQNQLHWLAAEINSVPVNEGSMRFHRKHGFIEVGQQQAAPGKVVSLQVLALD